MTKENGRSPYIIIGAMFLLFVWININMPYCGDDWSWGLEENARDWLLGASVNSRYAGNLIIVGLTRSTLLKVLLPAAVCTLLPLTAYKAACLGETQCGKNAVFTLLAAYALYFALPTVVWNETVGWYSGFANYVVSVLLLMIFVLMNINIADREDKSRLSGKKAAAAGVLTFIMQMFLENVSVYVIFVSAVLVIASLLIYRKAAVQYIAVFIGAAAGFAVMFSSNIYGTLLSEGEIASIQRGLSFEASGGVLMTLHSIAFNFCGTDLPRLYERNAWLCPALEVLVMAAMLVKRRELPRLVLLLLPLNVLFVLYSFSNSFGIADRLYGICWYYNVVYTAIMSVAVLAVTGLELYFLFRTNTKKTLAVLFFWVSAFLVLAPMAAVDYIGWRSYYTSYVFMLNVMLMLVRLISENGGRIVEKLCYGAICLAFAAGVLRFGVVYTEIGVAQRERAALIESALERGEKEIYLPALPWQDYMISPEPPSEARAESYKEFFGIPEDVKLIFEDGGKLY